MSEKAEAVLIANGKFYRALSLADSSAMRGLWLKSAEATCAHPGWHTLVGYESIQQSWAVVFVNQGPMHVWPSQEEVAFEGDVAWVMCLENIDATHTSANKILCVWARNAFRETATGWKMVQHLAEAQPGHEVQPTNQRLALN